jgi:hypothetical protein
MPQTLQCRAWCLAACASGTTSAPAAQSVVPACCTRPPAHFSYCSPGWLRAARNTLPLWFVVQLGLPHGREAVLGIQLMPLGWPDCQAQAHAGCCSDTPLAQAASAGQVLYRHAGLFVTHRFFLGSCCEVPGQCPASPPLASEWNNSRVCIRERMRGCTRWSIYLLYNGLSPVRDMKLSHDSRVQRV